jgi:hypothetical protein
MHSVWCGYIMVITAQQHMLPSASDRGSASPSIDSDAVQERLIVQPAQPLSEPQPLRGLQGGSLRVTDWRGLLGLQVAIGLSTANVVPSGERAWFAR